MGIRQVCRWRGSKRAFKSNTEVVSSAFVQIALQETMSIDLGLHAVSLQAGYPICVL